MKKTYKNQEILEIKDLKVSYGNTKVLKGVSLELIKGEVTVLFGPNGHGKSTLLKAICGVHTPSSGSIRFNGKQICGHNSAETVEMGISYIPEDRNVFPEMTVEENLILGAYNRRARKKIKETLPFVFSLFPRLEERKTQMARSLSGGESRMLAMGRGLMSCATLLLVDEPSIGLSPLIKKELYRTLSVIGTQIDISILIVEQEIEEALKIVDKVYLLRKGRIVLSKTGNEIKKEEIEKAYF